MYLCLELLLLRCTLVFAEATPIWFWIIVTNLAGVFVGVGWVWLTLFWLYFDWRDQPRSPPQEFH